MIKAIKKMTKEIFIALFLAGFSAFSQTTGQATYKLNIHFSEDVLKADAKFGMLIKAVEIAPELKYSLIFNHEKANFKYIENDRVDAVAANTANSVAGAGQLVFIDRQKKCLLLEIKGNKLLFKDKEYVIADSFISDWTITSEEKLIGDYLCYKATTVKDIDMGNYSTKQLITAYFCPKIPVPFGPGLYAGLPGLILELQDKNATFILQDINFRPVADAEIIIPSGKETITRKKWVEITNSRMENIRETIKE